MVRNVHDDLASIQLDDLNWAVDKTQAYFGWFLFHVLIGFMELMLCTVLW